MALAPSEATQETPDFLASVRSELQDFAARFREDALLQSTRELADTAAGVEELSRTVEQLQLVCAHALDRQHIAAVGESGQPFIWTDRSPQSGEEPGPKHTEFRDTADYLRARLGISRSEARRRLRVAASTMPEVLLAGGQVPPRLPVLGSALASSQISGQAATLIHDAVERVRPVATADDVAAMERMLTLQASEADLDILRAVARRWESGLDPDGREPTEELLRARQGVFLRGRRNGLHRLEIMATDEQYEHLITVMNTATNPRLHQTFAPEAGDSAGSQQTGGRVDADPGTEDPVPGDAAAVDADGRAHPAPAEPSRAQKLLNGLVGACQIALAAGKLPVTGGHRPQVMITISYEDLMKQTGGTGEAVFGGPVSAGMVRKIACDANLIPVVLGGQGEVLDVGRAQRLFTPAMRRALVARDGGCAFPGCTMPAHWTEAHHITWWENGGRTCTDEGCLLCVFHHHLIHQGNWEIVVRDRIPWFIPPGYVDPERKPLRNRYRQAGPASGP